MVVVALGLATWAGWTALDGATSGIPGGLSGEMSFIAVASGLESSSALQSNVWLRLGLRLAFVAAWAMASVWVLHEPGERRRARRVAFEGLGPIDGPADR